MVQKHDIISLWRQGKSLRAIAKELKLNRATVTKFVREYESTHQAENPSSALEDVLVTKPAYNQVRVRPARVLTEEITNEIDKWLVENDRRRSKGMRKQCLNAKDIHRELLEKDLLVSYSSVCKYITRIKEEAKNPRRTKEVFIRQEYAPGSECEYDWGDVKLEIAGNQVTLKMAVFTLAHSNGRYAYLFSHENTLALMEAHRNFFKEVNGVPETMVYDNMRVAVAFDGEGHKEPTLAMRRLTNFYHFGYRFCNARSGWEKGHVERSVEIVRGRAFKPRISFGSIHEAQEWLSKICRQMNSEAGSLSTLNKIQAINDDLEALMPYPGEMGCFELIECSVDKLSTIVFKYSHYSVPDRLAGERVFVKVYSEKLVIYDSSHKKVAQHERSYIKNTWTLDINHYIETLLRKPGALSGSTALKQMPQKMKDIYNVHFKDNGKNFILLLKYAAENNFTYDDIIKAADTVKRRGAKRLSLDLLRVSLEASRSTASISEEASQVEEFFEIELGSDDILTQLSTLMESTETDNNK